MFLSALEKIRIRGKLKQDPVFIGPDLVCNDPDPMSNGLDPPTPDFKGTRRRRTRMMRGTRIQRPDETTR
jgi:hypothetical protein